MRAAASLGLALVASCTTFASVRPAQVVSGGSLLVQGSASTPPGNLPGWMWSLECAQSCNHSVPGFEIGIGRGVVDSTRARYIEGGIAFPVTPYLEMYRQFGDRSRPRGAGFRVGAPVFGWGEYRVFYRADPRPDLTANTQLVVASGNSPNHENSATFIALMQSVALMDNGARSGLLPAVSFGITHTLRNRYGTRENAVGLLAVLSFTARSHRGPACRVDSVWPLQRRPTFSERVATEVAEFGGAFVDDTVYMVHLTSLDASERAAAVIRRELDAGGRQDLIPRIRFVRARYSYRQLRSWMDCAVRGTGAAGIRAWGVSDQWNRVTLTLENPRGGPTIEGRIRRLGLPLDAFHLE